MVTALCTRASVKEHAGITATTWDAVLDTLITRVSAAVEKHCRRTFGSTNYTEFYSGSRSQTLQLRNFPVTAITSIHEDGARTTYDSTTLIDSDDYTYDEDTGIVYYDARFPNGNKNVRVVYTAGYASVPDDVALAAVMWVLTVWNRRKSHGVANESGGGESGSYTTGKMPEEVEGLLAEYVSDPRGASR